jgi:glycosyltransferase involved in cell wall biosynthesis
MPKPILTIFYQFNPWRSSIGGIQTFICSFLKYAPEDFEVRLVGTGEPNSRIGIWQEREYAGRSIQFMPLIAIEDDNVRNLVPTTFKYTAALLGRNFASDFMHFYRIEANLAALNWSGEKTLLVQNDIQKQMDPVAGNNAILWQRFPAAYFALESLLIKQFDRIYACHTQSVKFYKQKYPEIAERFTYLKNTVDEEIFYPLSAKEKEAKRQALANKMGLPQETRFLLFAGRLHPQKDPLLLIRSLAVLDEPNIHLLIAGEGELAGEIQAEIKRSGVSERVTMLGAVPQNQLAQLHQLSNLFVLTSAYEGLPFVVLEALACGIPVVTTDCGETPQFLTSDSGIVCQERTPQVIAQALRQILQHPEDYSPANCVRTAQPYSARTVVTDVYQDMLQRWQAQSCVSTAA